MIIGQHESDPKFITGGLDKCQVNSPLTAKVIDGLIYIGDSSGSGSTRAGHILTLTYCEFNTQYILVLFTINLFGSNLCFFE